MREYVKVIGGRTYVSNTALEIGDYGGSNAIGVSNIKVIREEFGDKVEEAYDSYVYKEERYLTLGEVDDRKHTAENYTVLHTWGDYGHQQVWLAEDDEDCKGIIEKLEQYPVLDELDMSRVEFEWENEAWEMDTKRDCLSTLPEELQERVEEKLSEDDIFDCFRDAAEHSNTYYVHEQFAYFDVDHGEFSYWFRVYIGKKLGEGECSYLILRDRAQKSCGYRGHKLDLWEALTLGRSWVNHCQDCEMEVVVNIRPAANDIDISGEAVALNCTKEEKL